MTCGPNGDAEQSTLVGPTGGAERVLMHVTSDESARRIEAVLGSLGYAVVRALSSDDGDPYEDIARSATSRHSLTECERLVLLGVLRGRSTETIAADLNQSLRTAQWHLYNLYNKLTVDSRESLLRRALSLDERVWFAHALMRRGALGRLEQGVRSALTALRGQQVGEAIHELEQALAEIQ